MNSNEASFEEEPLVSWLIIYSDFFFLKWYIVNITIKIKNRKRIILTGVDKKFDIFSETELTFGGGETENDRVINMVSFKLNSYFCTLFSSILCEKVT